MITNILDRRTAVHRWTSVDAVAEATWHDNIEKATATHDNAVASIASGDTFEIRAGVSVAAAILWASAFPDEVTLYLYDAGTYPAGYRTDV